MNRPDLPTVAPGSYCINPQCVDRFNAMPDECCQSCGAPLLIAGRYRLLRPLRPLDPAYLTDVFEVEDGEDFERTKVLKVLARSQPKLVELLQREAEVLGRLEHPGIPQMEPDGYFTVPLPNETVLHCLVMEKVPGQNLKQWLEKQGAIAPELAFAWLEELAEIIELVHQQQFLHRDIKPTNIMRRPDGQLALIDFGTVREMTATYAEKESSGEVTRVYSQGFTAPEQIHGSPVPQSDFFSLGSTFVYLLSGCYPADLPRHPQTQRILWQEVRPALPPSLIRLLQTLMAPDVANRPANERQLRRLIRQGHRTYRRQQRLRYWMQGWIWQRRFQWLTGLGVAIAAGSVLIMGRQLHRQSQQILANQLTAQAEQLAQQRQFSQATLLSLEALQRLNQVDAATLSAEERLQQTLMHLPRLEQAIAHDQDVNSVAFSADGRWFASGSADGSVTVWDAQTQDRHTPALHDADIHAIAFRPNDAVLATASADGAVSLWDAARQTSLGNLPHEDSVIRLAFSNDGQFLATATAAGQVTLWNQDQQPVQQYNLGDYVSAIAWSPDGTWLAAASTEGTVRLWSVQDDRVLSLDQTSSVQALAFSAAGAQLAVAGGDTVHLWPMSTVTDTPEILGTESPSTETLNTETSGTEILGTGTSDIGTSDIGTLDTETSGTESSGAETSTETSRETSDIGTSDTEALDTATLDTEALDASENKPGTAASQQLVHDHAVSAIAFHPNGTLITASGPPLPVLQHYPVTVWDLERGQPIQQMAHDGAVTQMHLSPDGHYLATASLDQTARIWRLRDGSLLNQMRHDNGVFAVAWHPQQLQVATGSADNTARLWRVTHRTTQVRLPDEVIASQVLYSPDGEQLITVRDRTLQVWQAKTGEPTAAFTTEMPIERVAISPNGTTLAAVDSRHLVYLWDLAAQELRLQIQLADAISDLQFSPGSAYLATASAEGSARIWEVVSGLQLASLPHDSFVAALDFSPDGKFVATASLDNTARVWEWNLPTPREVVRLPHDSFVEAIAFTPEGRHLTTASLDNLARLWAWQDGQAQIVHRFRHAADVQSLALSPDGQHLATTSGDRLLQLLQNERVHLWSIATGQRQFTLPQQRLADTAVFSPNGRYLATVDAQGVLQIWDVVQEQKITQLAMDQAVQFATFSPTSLSLAVLAADGTVQTWQWSQTNLVDQACDRVQRNLTPQEWQQYLGNVPYRATCPMSPMSK